MIGWLNGKIVDRHQPGKLVLDVNGVGYDVETSLQTFFQVEPLTGSIGLHIHTVVREDALLLYGFFNKEERALFRALIKVNGLGLAIVQQICALHNAHVELDSPKQGPGLIVKVFFPLD